MTETVLAYDRAIAVQETGWWCGPASTQVVLNGLGQVVPEDTLAAEIEAIENPGRGDDKDGTDYIGLIEQVLDRRAPHLQYASVQMPNDPPTAEQKERFWRHLTQSIVGNRAGVIANIVAPPNNPPRAVKGSVVPPYPRSSTTFHYVAIMGVGDATAGRAVWITDSAAFGGITGFWCPFDGPGSICSLIPPKGYCYAAAPVTAAAEPAPAPGAGDPVALLSTVMGAALPQERYADLLPALAQCLRDCGATTAARIAMWCAQIGHESGGLRWMEELADGSAYEGRADLGNTQAGDGRRFKGRGAIQVTGRANYAALSKWAHLKGLVPTGTFFVDQPGQLAADRYAFVGAAWYWTVARPRLNAYADAGDLLAATRAINGGTNGIDDRRARWDTAKTFGDQLLALTAPTTATGDAMAAVPQEQWDRAFRELTQKLPSRSIYRTPGEGLVDTLAGMLLNLDAMAHAEMVERLARLGDRDALARVARTAAGQGAVTDRQAIAQAVAVLVDIERTNPAVLQSISATKG